MAGPPAIDRASGSGAGQASSHAGCSAAAPARRSSCRLTPTVVAVAILGVLVAGACRWCGAEMVFAAYGQSRKRQAAPYGRIGGKPIIPNPEAEKFPAGVPRDEDGFPTITLREQYETNVTMYKEGLGPYPGPPPDFSRDWDYIPLDPEDPDFDPDAPMPPAPEDAPEELMKLQPAGAVVWPEVTPDEPIKGKKRKVAAGPEA